MPDTTIKKVEAGSSPKGEMGQKYLVAGKRVSMRLWVDEPGGKLKAPTACAMAPPSTLMTSSDKPRAFVTAIAIAAKASLISIRWTSPVFQPARSSAWRTAGPSFPA